MRKTITVLLAIFFPLILSAQLPLYLNPHFSVEHRVNDLIGRMTLVEKIAQMMQLDLSVTQTNPSLLTQYSFGSVLSGGGSDPLTGNSAESWANTYDMLQSHAINSRLKIPILYGIDAVHGHNNVLGATIFPHNIGLGCTQNPELIKQAARISAIEIAATGIDWTFAPCIAVPRDERWGRTYEGFGETPELAQLYGSAAVRGFQTDSLSHPTSILACAKHFVGDGGTTDGIDQGNTELTEELIRSIHLPGYKTAIDSGVGSIMISYSSINGIKMHGNKHWITDILKNELGFNGIIVSDWAGVDQINSDYKKSVELAINAGIDMVMLPTRYNDFLNAMKSLVQEGKIDTGRIDDAVKRILTMKFNMGLFERPFADKSLLSLIGSQDHRAVARQCVRESMVLLKKKDGILPLKKSNARILVAGSHADDIGYQCGGWTITWQGKSGDIIEGTTILEGMKNATPNADIEFSMTGDFQNSSADYSVVVIGEKPYAEGRGDSKDLRIQKSDVELVKRMKGYGAPVIVILVTGRPVILEKIQHYADVIFAAWLPGTEGDGISDVLFGDFQPKGKLSISWPKTMAQIPINVGDVNYSPLYAYGYGIDSFADSPVGSSPVCLSAIVTSGGNKIELTFNKKMKVISSATSSFTVTRNQTSLPAAVRKTSLKSNDSTTIVLELDSEYFSRDDVASISYNGSGIESYDGGLLQPFSSLDVYNWTRPLTANIPTRIESEDYNDMYGVSIEATNDTEGNFHITDIDAGDWMEYSINIPAEGNYYVSLRIASESTPGQALLISAENSVAKILPVTGSWQTWQTTTSTTMHFPAGEQSFTIKALTGGFRLNWISITSIPSAIEDRSIIPNTIKLEQNYPNPFNAETVIRFHLPEQQLATLKVFDVLGKEIATLVDEIKPAGIHIVSWKPECMCSGVYFYRLQTANFSDVRKLVILK